jgi:hypothetical protein
MRKCSSQKKALRKVLMKQKMKKVKVRKMKLNFNLASNSSSGRIGEIFNKINNQRKWIWFINVLGS